MDGYDDIVGQLRVLVGDPRQYSADELTSIISEALAGVPDSLVSTVLDQFGDGAAAIPESPMAQAQELDSKYRIRPHLTYLNERITQAVHDVEAGKSRMVRISLPPRSGKSSYVSLHLPAWLLRKHPDWKIGMVSYADPLAVSWGRGVRRIIEANPQLGIRLAPDLAMAAEWQTTEGGGIVSRGINSGYTGVGFKCLDGDTVIQSEYGPLPIRDAVARGVNRVLAYDHRSLRPVWRRVEAVSATRRGDLVEVRTQAGRVLRCTADHLVYAGGRYCPAGDLRPGDEMVAVDDPHGMLLRDDVRPSARRGAQERPEGTPGLLLSGLRHSRAGDHPVWPYLQRMRGADTRPPSLLLAGMQGGGGGPCAAPAGWGVPGMWSHLPSEVLPAGVLLAGVRERRPRSADEGARELAPQNRAIGHGDVSAAPPGGAGSRWGCVRDLPVVGGSDRPSPRRGSVAQHAGEPCDTVQGVPLAATQEQRDIIVSVVPLPGVQMVYDLQVEGTHNLFANGVLVHNCLIIDDPVKGTAEAHSKAYRDAEWERWTSDLYSRLEPPFLTCVLGTRWHEDDLIGRLASTEYAGDPDAWEAIEFPAIAEAADVLGRNPGDPLFSPLLDETVDEALARWADIKASIGSYHWAALYQGHPAPSKGTIFDISTFRYWTTDRSKVIEGDDTIVYINPATDLAGARWLDSWDCAFKGTDTSDWVVGQRWARSGPNRYLIGQKRGKWTFTQTLAQMEEWAIQIDDAVSPFGRFVHQRLIEDKANGTAIIDVLRKTLSGIKEMPANVSKESRARAITPEVESGHVYLPHPSDPGNEWVAGAVDELRDFPKGKNDDICDALVHALTELRDMGIGIITVPKRSMAARQTAASVLTARRSGATGRLQPGRRVPGR